MATPLVHAKSSSKKFGGKPEEYLKIHEKMDCSKKYFPDNRHRALTHNMFWIFEVIIPLYGDYITISNGKQVSVKDICELHILEDYHFRFIPTVQDFLQEIPMKNWMQNGLRAKKFRLWEKDMPDSAYSGIREYKGLRRLLINLTLWLNVKLTK